MVETDTTGKESRRPLGIQYRPPAMRSVDTDQMPLAPAIPAAGTKIAFSDQTECSVGLLSKLTNLITPREVRQHRKANRQQ